MVMTDRELYYSAARANIEQTELAIAAALRDKPTMPPEGIHPLRWKAMVTCMKNAIKLGLEDQI